MAETYRDLERYVRGVIETRAKFIADNPWPFLVKLPATMPTPSPWDDDFTYNTHVPGIDPEDDEGEDRPSHATVIQPVRKRPGGPFPMRVGIGRTRSCDIALRFATVSKLHAQFHMDEPEWTLVDLESANGTFVDGVRLVARRPCRVSIGARLRFGSVETELVEAATLYDRLRALQP